jgi:tetratricopeptide (TPR) repeat protein
MDPENPVVRLCAEGMQAEMQGRADDARALYQQAWEARRDDYEACVAAHFLARQQDTPADELRWNREALDRADAAGDERVRGFHPSLYLNLGHSHETLGELDEARRCYALAEERLSDVPPGPYGDHVRGGVARGRMRTG